jgi:uncharacterized protein YndB with AHSA1/START domain
MVAMPPTAPPTVTESITIDAPPEQVYDLVANVSAMGDFSPEATGARGRISASPKVGDRFVGTNRRGPVMWFTFCTIRQAEPARAFAFDVDFGPFPISYWSYTFEPSGGGTRVTESWTDRRDGIRGLPMKAVGQLLIPGSRPEHNRANMLTTLRRLKARAEHRHAG